MMASSADSIMAESQEAANSGLCRLDQSITGLFPPRSCGGWSLDIDIFMRANWINKRGYQGGYNGEEIIQSLLEYDYSINTTFSNHTWRRLVLSGLFSLSPALVIHFHPREIRP